MTKTSRDAEDQKPEAAVAGADTAVPSTDGAAPDAVVSTYRPSDAYVEAVTRIDADPALALADRTARWAVFTIDASTYAGWIRPTPGAPTEDDSVADLLAAEALAKWVRENPEGEPAILFRHAGMVGCHGEDLDDFRGQPLARRLGYTLFRDVLLKADAMLQEEAALVGAAAASEAPSRRVDAEKTILRKRQRRGALSDLGKAVARQPSAAGG